MRWTRADGSAQCDLDGVVPSQGSLRAHEVPNGVLLTWGAGTSVAEAALCRSDSSVEWFGGAALSVSPDGRHLLAYTPPEAPLAERDALRLASLVDGTVRLVGRGRPTEVRWRARLLELRIDGRRLRVPL